MTSSIGPPPSSDPGIPWWTRGWVGGVLVAAVTGVVFSAGVEVAVPLLAEPLPAASAAAPEPVVEPVIEPVLESPAAPVVEAPAPTGRPPRPEKARKAVAQARAQQARAEQRRARIRRERRAARELAVLARRTFATWGPISGTWVRPIEAYRTSSHYGETGPHWESIHTGQDLSARTGTPVRAVTAGMVTFSGWDGPYGNKLEITHPDGNVTWYAHLSRLGVNVTDQVSTGQVVGQVGSTGNSTGPHLHFEVRPDGGAAVDPVAVLKSHGVDL